MLIIRIQLYTPVRVNMSVSWLSYGDRPSTCPWLPYGGSYGRRARHKFYAASIWKVQRHFVRMRLEALADGVAIPAEAKCGKTCISR